MAIEVWLSDEELAESEGHGVTRTDEANADHAVPTFAYTEGRTSEETHAMGARGELAAKKAFRLADALTSRQYKDKHGRERPSGDPDFQPHWQVRTTTKWAKHIVKVRPVKGTKMPGKSGEPEYQKHDSPGWLVLQVVEDTANPRHQTIRGFVHVAAMQGKYELRNDQPKGHKCSGDPCKLKSHRWAWYHKVPDDELIPVYPDFHDACWPMKRQHKCFVCGKAMSPAEHEAGMSVRAQMAARAPVRAQPVLAPRALEVPVISFPDHDGWEEAAAFMRRKVDDGSLRAMSPGLIRPGTKVLNWEKCAVSYLATIGGRSRISVTSAQQHLILMRDFIVANP